ncbi:MAG: ribbon-helix-helix protein, CopG family [Chloroflexota bacterium]|nr:ribbon-helix-helix protein, CopG family [Chloroflexota bacterium]
MAPIISRNTETITFSLPPPQAQRLREVAQEEERTVSELLREAIRLYMEEREWRAKERMQRRSRQTNTDESEAR